MYNGTTTTTTTFTTATTTTTTTTNDDHDHDHDTTNNTELQHVICRRLPDGPQELGHRLRLPVLRPLLQHRPRPRGAALKLN